MVDEVTLLTGLIKIQEGVAYIIVGALPLLPSCDDINAAISASVFFLQSRILPFYVA